MPTLLPADLVVGSLYGSFLKTPEGFEGRLLDLLRCLFGLTALPLCVRLFEFFSFEKEIGVLLVCTRNMFGNLYHWLVPMLLLNLGFSVSFSILAPNFYQGSEFQAGPPPGQLRPFTDLSLDLSAGGPFFMPFWALFGFFEPGELGGDHLHKLRALLRQRAAHRHKSLGYGRRGGRHCGTDGGRR